MLFIKCMQTIRIIGITDYEDMFKDTISIMKQMHGITGAQVFRITPRRGASPDQTGVDVLYMTNFSRGACLLCYLHMFIALLPCVRSALSYLMTTVRFTCRPSCVFSHARLSAACLGKLLSHVRSSGASNRLWLSVELSAT